MLLLKQILSCMPRNQQMRSDKLSWLAGWLPGNGFTNTFCYCRYTQTDKTQLKTGASVVKQ